MIEYVSKTLTSTERRYPQVQREALVLVWGVEKFYFYLLGMKFTIFSAQKLILLFSMENIEMRIELLIERSCGH